MAKGDRDKVDTAINQYGSAGTNSINNTRGVINQQNQMFNQNYQDASKKAGTDYDTIMGNYENFLHQPPAGSSTTGTSGAGGANFDQEYAGYQNFANGGGNVGLDPKYQGDVDQAIEGYKGFAANGGFSPTDISELRARAISPTRAVYSNARANVDRSQSLSGGAPNYAAATAKMAREQSQQASDANVNANASIAQAVQQGKLQGNAGLASTALSEQSAQLQVDQINNQMKLSGLGGMTDIDKARLTSEFQNRSQQLQAMSGETSLYGTAPGATKMYGDELLHSTDQMNTNTGQQANFSLGMIDANQRATQIPSNFQSAMGNLSSIFGLASSGANATNNIFKPTVPSGGRIADPGVNPYTGIPNSIEDPYAGGSGSHDYNPGPYGTGDGYPSGNFGPPTGPTPDVGASWGVGPYDPGYDNGMPANQWDPYY